MDRSINNHKLDFGLRTKPKLVAYRFGNRDLTTLADFHMISLCLLQHPARRPDPDLFNRRLQRKRHRMDHSLGHRFHAQHFLPRRLGPELVPDGGVGGPGYERQYTNSALAEIEAQRVAETQRAVLRCVISR